MFTFIQKGAMDLNLWIHWYSMKKKKLLPDKKQLWYIFLINICYDTMGKSPKCCFFLSIFIHIYMQVIANDLSSHKVKLSLYYKMLMNKAILTSQICNPMFIITIKIEYHAVVDTWWQPLLSYGKWCTELKIGSFIY